MIRTELKILIGIAVVVVVGVIVIIAKTTVDVSEGLAESKVKQAKTDLHTLDNCIDLYKIEKRRYPTTEEGLKAVVAAGKCKPQLKDPWGHDYVYRYPGTVHPKSYDLLSYGADGQPGGEGRNADIIYE